MAKIFYRERVKIAEGDQQPRFAVVGVQGTDMTFFHFHLRKSELEAIAQAIGGELIMLPRGTGENEHKHGSGKKKGRGHKKTATRHHDSES